MKKIIIWLIIIVLAAVAFVYFARKSNSTPNSNNVATTTNSTSTNNNNGTSNTSGNSSISDTNVIPLDWVATSTGGVSFKYPNDLDTQYQYVRATDWPPVVNVEDQSFSCTEGGDSPTARAGQTKLESIQGQDYCVTVESEGAAGSIYTSYAYAFPYQYRTAILTFTFQFPQCMNYDDPKQTECKNEESAFDITPVIANIRHQIETNNN